MYNIKEYRYNNKIIKFIICFSLEKNPIIYKLEKDNRIDLWIWISWGILNRIIQKNQIIIKNDHRKTINKVNQYKFYWLFSIFFYVFQNFIHSFIFHFFLFYPLFFISNTFYIPLWTRNHSKIRIIMMICFQKETLLHLFLLKTLNSISSLRFHRESIYQLT